MAELVHQTWSRVTGRPWSDARAGGFTTGTAQANLALQAKLNSGWNPYAPAAPAPAPAPAPAANSYTAAAAPISQAITNKDAELKAQEDALLAERSGFVNSQESLPALYARLLQEAGVPALQAQLEPVRQETLTTEEMLRKLSGDVQNLTRGQGDSRRRLVEAGRRDPLVEQLGDLARVQERFAGQIASATQGVGQQSQLYNEEYKRKLNEFDVRMAAFGERAARESSNFTKAKELELDAIFAQIKRAEDLSDQEADRAFQLLMQQKDFQNSLALQRSSGGGGGGGGGGSSASSKAQQQVLDQWENIKKQAETNSTTPGGIDTAKYQDYLYRWITDSGKSLATKAGLDPELFWSEWRNAATGVSGIKLR